MRMRMQVAGLAYVVKLQRAETSPLGGKQQFKRCW
nr:MAG TPA: hypothetical protein [Caudoviricetes sp.]